MMNVAFAFNHYYLEPTLISIFSFLRARKADRPVTLYLLVEEDVTEEQLSPPFQMAEDFGNCRVSVLYPQKMFRQVFCSDETCPGEIRIVPKRFNVFPGDIPPLFDDLRGMIPDGLLEEEDLQDPAIVHYIGPDKPWQKETQRRQYWTEAEDAFAAWRDRKEV